MANSIKFMNEGFEAKYGNIKPDLCEQIYTVLKRLTEANMSPEDEADTKLLYSIYKKKMERSNAQLSPKELQVLDKYNLEEPRTSKDYYGRKDVRSSTRTDSEFRGPNVFEPVRRNGYINRKANLADRAKKMDARSNSRDDIGKYDKDYRLNYMYMKNAVNDKKYNQRKLDNLEREYDQEESNLRARLNALKKEREQEKSRYNSAINNSQYEINTLLKRESLDKLQEAISTLNERKQEWSDEDKKDTALLYNIYDKRVKRSNAALTPEERAVLKKYNLEVPTLTKHTAYARSGPFTTRRMSSKTATGEPDRPDLYTPFMHAFFEPERGLENKNVNLADRARKMNQRQQNKTLSGKYDKDFRQNYRDLKTAVQDKKTNQKQLDTIDSMYDKWEKRLKQERENDKKGYQQSLDANNDTINKILKRESLLSEDKLTGFNDGENLKHEINEFLENLVIRWNHEYDIQLTRADLDNAYEFVMLHFLWDDLLDESFKKKL